MPAECSDAVADAAQGLRRWSRTCNLEDESVVLRTDRDRRVGVR
jgi:hypothetical protein